MRKIRTLFCKSKERAEGRFNYEFVQQNGDPDIITPVLVSCGDHIFNNNVKVGTTLHIFASETQGE